MKKLVSFLIFALIIIHSTIPAFAITQYSYLFRNNDGNEIAATAAASENYSLNNLSREQKFRLRLGIKTEESDNHALQKSSSSLNFDNEHLSSIVVDAGNEFAYIGTNGTPAKIMKISLNNLQIVNTITLDSETTGTSSINNLNTANISADGQHVYFATHSDPIQIVKVNLTNFSYEDHLEFLPGTAYATSAVVDPHGSYLYVGTKNREIIRIELNNFSEVNTDVISLSDDETGLYSAIINNDGSRIYFGTYTTPGKIITINTGNNSFYKMNSYTLSQGNNLLRTASLDPSTNFAYFGTATKPGKIIKIDLLLADKEQAIVELPEGTGNFYSSEFSDLNNEIYMMTFSDPGKVVTLNLSNFNNENADILTISNDQNFYTSAIVNDEQIIIGTESTPGKLIQLEGSTNKYQFRLEYGINTQSCDDITEWYDVFDSNNIELIDSIHIGESISTNVENLVSDATGTFINGQLLEFDSQSNVIEINSDEFTELEYSLKAKYDAQEGNYCFRLTNAGNSGSFLYQKYPTLNIGEINNVIQNYVEGESDDQYIVEICENSIDQNNCTAFNCEDNINNPACTDFVTEILEKQAQIAEEEEIYKKSAEELMESGETCIHNDLPTEYQYCPQIIYNYELGTFTGDGQGNFRPESGVLRAESAKILNVAKKINISNYDNEGNADFNDTNSGEWYIKYLKASRDTKVIYGYPDGSFKPGQEAIRAEFVTMLTRALDINVSDACDTEYAPDIIANSYWGPSACYLIKNDILDLDGETNFNPTEPMTRIDIARMLYNAKSMIN
ncbi:S-layer homology domain-containing protein [Patescibacteria group bacterium]